MPAWTTPSHVTSGPASSAQFNAETADNLQHLYDRVGDTGGEAWPAFTPVLRNAGRAPVTVTNAFSSRARRGRTILYVARLIVTSDSAGVGVIQVDLPVAPVAVNNLQVGTFTFLDASVGPNTHYAAAAYIDTATGRVYGIRDNIVGAGGMATQLGINDVVTCCISYPSLS